MGQTAAQVIAREDIEMALQIAIVGIFKRGRSRRQGDSTFNRIYLGRSNNLEQLVEHIERELDHDCRRFGRTKDERLLLIRCVVRRLRATGDIDYFERAWVMDEELVGPMPRIGGGAPHARTGRRTSSQKTKGDDRKYHGRPKSARRLPFVPTSTTPSFR